VTHAHLPAIDSAIDSPFRQLKEAKTVPGAKIYYLTRVDAYRSDRRKKVHSYYFCYFLNYSTLHQLVTMPKGGLMNFLATASPTGVDGRSTALSLTIDWPTDLNPSSRSAAMHKVL